MNKQKNYYQKHTSAAKLFKDQNKPKRINSMNNEHYFFFYKQYYIYKIFT